MAEESPAVEVKPIPGFDGYFAGRDGSVWSYLPRWAHHSPTWKRLSQMKSGQGYYHVSLRANGRRERRFTSVTKKVHHLVLEAFVGPRPEGMVCCHQNDDPADNRLENLRWDTPASNNQDAIRNGCALFGEDNHATKLTNLDIRIMRHLAKRGAKPEAVALTFGVAYSTARAVMAGDRRADVPGHGGDPFSPA